MKFKNNGKPVAPPIRSYCTVERRAILLKCQVCAVSTVVVCYDDISQLGKYSLFISKHFLYFLLFILLYYE